jgi:hypothetical protein
MKVRHKKLRHGSIACGPLRFTINEKGFLVPDPTVAQWNMLGMAHAYLEIVERDPPLAVDAAAPAPAPVMAEEQYEEPAAPEAPAEEQYEPPAEEDEADESEAIFSDDVDPDAEEVEAGQYSALSLDELRTLCRERGIRTARVNKADLISLLNAADLGV